MPGTPPVHRADGVLADVVGGNTLLIGSAGTDIVEINAVGSAVWEAIDGTRDVAGLVDVVRAKVSGADTVPVEQLRGDVEGFLEELTRLQLIRP